MKPLTDDAGNSIHLSGRQIEKSAAVLLELGRLERLGQQVRRVVVRADVLGPQRAQRLELAHLEVPAIDVTRPMAGLAIARQLNRARVVDEQLRRFGLER